MQVFKTPRTILALVYRDHFYPKKTGVKLSIRLTSPNACRVGSAFIITLQSLSDPTRMGRLIVYYDDLTTSPAMGLGVVYRAKPHDTSGNVDTFYCCHDGAVRLVMPVTRTRLRSPKKWHWHLRVGSTGYLTIYQPYLFRTTVGSAAHGCSRDVTVFRPRVFPSPR